MLSLLLWSMAAGAAGAAALTSVPSSSSSSFSSSFPKLLQPYGKPGSSDPLERRTLVRSDGVRVTDSAGKVYIDGIGSLWYCQVGYGREEIISAVSHQLRTLSYNQFPPWSCEVVEEAASRIVELSPTPDGRVYLCTSGSEAIDTSFKIARTVAQLKHESERQIIIRRSRGYHGVNIGGTSAQGIASNREGWGDLLPHVVEMDAEDIASAESIFAKHGDRIAAVVTEPIQAAAGVYPPPEGYLQRLRELCTAHDALLIFDEVITGFGRTGNWFASQTYGVTPDVMTFAKGATSGYQPLGGVVLSRDVCDVLEADPNFVFRHGHTYSGHAASCAACLANVDVMEREGLVDRAKDVVGARLSSGLNDLLDRGKVREVRGVGALWAARLNTDDSATTAAVRDRMLDHGVIARPLYDSIAFCPPLVMSEEDVDRMIDALGKAVNEVGG